MLHRNRASRLIFRSRDKIAGLSGTTVEATIGTISRLRERNIVRPAGNHILVTDAHQLARIAEQL